MVGSSYVMVQSMYWMVLLEFSLSEARTHGVGYYNFSQDENERLRQQEALKEMREEAEKNQAIARNLKEKREQQMKQRLAAARRRKCERLGLSPDAVLETDLQDGELIMICWGLGGWLQVCAFVK